MLVYQLDPRGGLKVVDFSPALGIVPGCGHAYLRLPGESKTLSRAGRARSAGIRPGMPLAEATALAQWALDSAGRERRTTKNGGQPASKIAAHSAAPASAGKCAEQKQLHLELYDPLADRLALEELARWCQRFSPLVGLEEGERPESLLMDVTGLARFSDGEEQLAERIDRQLAERGFRARVAIAETIGAAWALAHVVAPHPLRETAVRPTEKTPLPLGEGGRRPGEGVRDRQSLAHRNELHPSPFLKGEGVGPLGEGVTVAPPGRAWAALEPLPVESLRISVETVALLAELGIRRIGQLARLPRSMLSARFGFELVKRLNQASGGAREVIVAEKLPPEWEREWLLEYPTQRRETISLVLNQLIGRLADELACQRRGVTQMECRFHYLGGGGMRLAVGLFRASATARHLRELVELQLERLRFEDAVSAVWVIVTSAGLLDFEQQPLFSGQSSRDVQRALAAMTDRLSSRLGRGAVLRPSLVSDAQPEFACVGVPLSAWPSHASRKKRTGGAKLAGPLERPLCLYPEPIALRVVAVAPDGPPVQFHHNDTKERIVYAWGPERIETGWWRSWCVRRDYYRVETTSGGRYWLFRRLQDRKWFLHGTFE